MVYFYDEKDDIKKQVQNVMNELDFEIKAQKQQLDILLECLNRLNLIIQNTSDIEKPQKFTNLLRDIKTSLDYTRSNISNIKKLKKYVSINDENDKPNIEKEKYNELAFLYKDVIQKTLNNYNNCLLKYIKNIEDIIGTEKNIANDNINTLDKGDDIIKNDEAGKKITQKETSETIDNTNKEEQYKDENVKRKKDFEKRLEKKLEEKTKKKSSKKENKKAKGNKNKEKDNVVLNEESENQNIENNVETCKNKKTEIKDNNVLVISEIKGKVFLPYTVNEVNTLFEKNKKYADIQEVIDNDFVVPIERYKNSAISRFKEAYNLMRKKEKASRRESLDVAVEVAFNGSLNPAIITACKNVEELDDYLDCLESDSLDNFKKFEIRYEVLPIK